VELSLSGLVGGLGEQGVRGGEEAHAELARAEPAAGVQEEAHAAEQEDHSRGAR
jgi:hypothetical protein